MTDRTQDTSDTPSAHKSKLLLFRRCATLLSAIGFVAVAACWLRSYWPLEIEHDKGYWHLRVLLYQGTLLVEWGDCAVHPPRGFSYRSLPFMGVATNLLPIWFVDPYLHRYQLGIPLVYPALLLIIMPLLWLLPFHRIYLRRLRNQCVQCGYDLTGNTTGRCPECGTQI